MAVVLKNGSGGTQRRVFSARQIAELSQPELRRMPDQDLVRVVHAAEMPLLKAEDLVRLPLLDRETLLRLGFLAQKYCRNSASRWSALAE